MKCACVALFLVHAAVAAPLPAHPRLIMNAARVIEINSAISTNADANYFYSSTLAEAEWVLTQKPFGPQHGPTGTPNDRPILQRLYALGVVYRLSSNKTFAIRAVPELMNAVAADQWDVNSTATLNTGEMLHAVGMAFDWFYDALTPTQRTTIVNATVALGLSHIRSALSATPPSWAVSFVNTSSNWNTVILGGTIVAVLGLADEPTLPPWVVDELLPAALAGIQSSLIGWGDDGGWMEGNNYAGYTARYLAPASMSLLTATGSDALLTSVPGVRYAPRFLVHQILPNRPLMQTYAWGDAPVPQPEAISQYLAFARFFNDSAYAYAVRHYTRSVVIPPNSSQVVSMNAPVALMYFTDAGSAADLSAQSLIKHFGHPQLVTARSSWGDSNVTFIGFKGSNVSWAWAHNHLDQGSFVFGTNGSWFVGDLGSDSYSDPSYFGPNRYALYRTNTSGHNTIGLELVQNGRPGAIANPHCRPNTTYTSICTPSLLELFNVTNAAASTAAAAARYNAGAASPGTDLRDALPYHASTSLRDALSYHASSTATDAFAIVNMTQAYVDAGHLGRVGDGGRLARGFIIMSNVSELVTVDEMLIPASASDVGRVRWAAHTYASVTVSDDNLTASLSIPGRVTVKLAIVPASTACPGAAFSVSPVDLPPPNEPTTGMSLVSVFAPARSCTRLTVLVGVRGDVDALTAIRPLADWAANGPWTN